ncbi:Deleted in malignant brain tumors 1 protein [Apostichopus japonicus]|uniref:Deleted in malignant brain tumors 1 protein n=1 Tax=Stichopus japonicus TaxID=307972 RepID=A0A2G8KX04_STIJA|nr:Deleted in malignant brain tumors 1 protein [Apostichopus japonicus]
MEATAVEEVKEVKEVKEVNEVTTVDPDKGRKLSSTTQTAVLNVLYNNLQKAIIDCVAKGSSLLLSVSDTAPKLQSLPGRAVINIPGDVQVVNLSKDIRNILMNEDVYLKQAAAPPAATPSQNEEENEGVEFRKEINLEPLAKPQNDDAGIWNCICMHCSASFSRLCPVFKAQIDELIQKRRQARKKRPYRPDPRRSLRVKCKYCDKVVTNQSIKFHLQAHEGMNYPCNFCSKTFKTPFSQVRHEKLHFTAKKEIQCPHCPKAFPTRGSFNVHLNIKHRSLQRHFCDICGKGWYFAHQVTLHRRVHTGELPFVCEHCGRGFRLKHQLSLHMKQHDPNKPTKRKSPTKRPKPKK